MRTKNVRKKDIRASKANGTDECFKNEQRTRNQRSGSHSRHNGRNDFQRFRSNRRGRANKWGTLSYNNQRYRENYRHDHDQYPSSYMSERELTAYLQQTPNNRFGYENHPDANEGYPETEPRNSTERMSSHNECLNRYSGSNYGFDEIPVEEVNKNDACNTENKPTLDNNSKSMPQKTYDTDQFSKNTEEVHIAVAENYIIQQVKQEKCLEAAQKAKENANENQTLLNNFQEKAPVKRDDVTEKEKQIESENILKKRKKLKTKSSEDVVCLGEVNRFENLVDESNDGDDIEQISEDECLICDKKGHNSFRCQMICKNCSAPYHNLKTCPKPINMSIMFQQFMEFCMQQSCQYNPEYKFSIGSNVMAQSTPEKKTKESRRKLKEKDDESNDSDSDSSSETKMVSRKRKKRGKKNESQIEQNSHYPAFSSPFAQTLPFSAFSGHAAAAYNPMMAFSQMIPGAYNPAAVAAMTFKR